MRLPIYLVKLIQWFDAKKIETVLAVSDSKSDNAIDIFRIIPYILLHIACFGVFWVGISKTAVVIAVVLYGLRVFAITGFYHRYFSHRTFKTSRTAQFIFALLGASSAQRGPIWWAAHHRDHHRYSDQPEDAHSPKQDGFLWSHMLWFLSNKNVKTKFSCVPDLVEFPELMFLDRFDKLVPVILAALLFLIGHLLFIYAPFLGTNGLQMLVWGFFISTIAVMQATFCINSLTHCFGSRRYATKDDSRNNLWLALLTFGEGWHNNHHHFPGSVHQGFYWWEIDITYYILRLLAAFGIIWDLHKVPLEIRDLQQNKNNDALTRPG